MPTETKADTTKQLNTRIDAALHATITAFAAMEGISLGKYVERAIWLDLEANRKDYAERLLKTVQGVAQFAPGVDTGIATPSAKQAAKKTTTPKDSPS